MHLHRARDPRRRRSLALLLRLPTAHLTPRLAAQERPERLPRGDALEVRQLFWGEWRRHDRKPVAQRVSRYDIVDREQIEQLRGHRGIWEDPLHDREQRSQQGGGQREQKALRVHGEEDSL